MRKIYIILFLVLLTACGQSFAQENFPYLGVVSGKNVNVRAGQDTSFERIHRLQSGDKVVIVDKNFSWLKIKLPVGAKCYVDQRYVDHLSSGIGEISGSRVNIRAGAGENHSVIGQLKRGTKVRTKKKKNGWVRIEPVEGIYGWIKEDFVKFRSTSVPPPKVVAEPTRNIYTKARQRRAQQKKEEAYQKQRAAEQSKTAAPKRQTRLVSETVTRSIVVSGMLMKLDSGDARQDIKHQLLVNEQKTYYLQAPGNIIDRFHKHKVKVEGTLEKRDEYQYYQVIKVQKISFIL